MRGKSGAHAISLHSASYEILTVSNLVRDHVALQNYNTQRVPPSRRAAGAGLVWDRHLDELASILLRPLLRKPRYGEGTRAHDVADDGNPIETLKSCKKSGAAAAYLVDC